MDFNQLGATNITLSCPLPPAPASDVLSPLDAANRLSLKQVVQLSHGERDSLNYVK